MATKRKSWQEKLHTGQQPKTVVLEKNFSGMKAGDKMLVSSPEEVDAFIRSVPSGKSLTIREVRQALAERRGAAGACPTSTSIFIRISAEAAIEEMQQGKDPAEVTPFWRVVTIDSTLASKLSCGVERLAALRAAEGI